MSFLNLKEVLNMELADRPKKTDRTKMRRLLQASRERLITRLNDWERRSADARSLDGAEGERTEKMLLIELERINSEREGIDAAFQTIKERS
jgi:hypothetical protein